MNTFIGFAKSWWGQVFILLGFFAALTKFTGFSTDVKAITTGTGTVINDLKVS